MASLPPQGVPRRLASKPPPPPWQFPGITGIFECRYLVYAPSEANTLLYKPAYLQNPYLTGSHQSHQFIRSFLLVRSAFKSGNGPLGGHQKYMIAFMSLFECSPTMKYHSLIIAIFCSMRPS